MRVVLLVLLVVLAACSVPADSAATTTTEATTTTTTLAATTTSGSECVERDGVLNDSRGFVCPPNMHVGRHQVGHRLSDVAGYRAGSYTTRVFQPGFTFTREEGFDSSGENRGVVPFDEHPTCDTAECFRLVVALSPETVESFDSNLGTVAWITNIVSSPVEYWGATGTRIDFSIGDCPSGTCFLSLEGFQDTWGFQGGQSASLLSIEVPGGPIGFIVAAHRSRFDQYWTEVAEPILASIEFADG